VVAKVYINIQIDNFFTIFQYNPATFCGFTPQLFVVLPRNFLLFYPATFCCFAPQLLKIMLCFLQKKYKT